MKPIYLEMQAFGPYAEKQTVDFEQLSEKGIFLIKGKTGSGKTTIFDAMTFALYGGSSGDADKSKTGRNDFEEWRCNQSPREMDTYVYFEFSSRGHSYYFKRILEPKRVNLATRYEAGEIDDDGNHLPFFNNPKEKDLKEKAEELIGLTKEQFRQVVLLPQGQFEKFLTASSDEKEKILNKIFDTYKWDAYTKSFFNIAKDRKDRLDSIKVYVNNSLREEELTSLEELGEKIEGYSQEREKNRLAHEAFDADGKREKLNEDYALVEQFKPLHDLQKDRDKLLGEKEYIASLNEKYIRAKKAEPVREAIEDYEKAEKDFYDRENSLKALTDKESAMKSAEASAKETLEKHNSVLDTDELQRQIGEYKSKADVYESFDKLLREKEKLSKEFSAAEAALKKAENSSKEAKEKATELYQEFETADSESKDYRIRHFRGIYGELAAELEDNRPCPVCGSESHPNPAQKTADSVSKEEMKSKEDLAEAAKERWKAQDEESHKCETEYKVAQTSYNEKKNALAESEAGLKTARANLVEDISDITALNDRINKLNDRIEQFNKKTAELKAACDKAHDDYSGLLTRIDTAKRERDKAQEAYSKAGECLNEAIKKNDFATVGDAKSVLLPEPELDSLHEKIVTYEAKWEENERRLRETKEKLEGKSEPDSSKFTERQDEIKDENNRFKELEAKLTSEITRLEKKKRDLSGKYQHYMAEIHEAENDLTFAKKLRGDTGMGLERYVIAVMFNQIIGEANEMLQKVHGGRYTLFRTDEKGVGNKSGLELKVHDNRSPEKEGRPVAMLSGGEKFLVSLALSIGMSTVAQKSGVQIEALFIDEGFGTLDDSSIDDAMDILDSVRKGRGTIGIISHVAVLEDTIPTQLEVVKSDKGNYIRTC